MIKLQKNRVYLVTLLDKALVKTENFGTVQESKAIYKGETALNSNRYIWEFLENYGTNECHYAPLVAEEIENYKKEPKYRVLSFDSFIVRELKTNKIKIKDLI